MVNVRGMSSRKRKGEEEEATGTEGLAKKVRVEAERDFRSVWSAVAPAHSSTLQRRVWGGE